MFLCIDKCHKEEEKKYNCMHFLPSYGPCEQCGITTACYDCKAYKDKPPISPLLAPPTENVMNLESIRKTRKAQKNRIQRLLKRQSRNIIV